jgi:predicted aldo/keto reductase-like oxidoreductase
MTTKKNENSAINRRGFLKTVGAAGIGTALVTTRLFADSQTAAKDANTAAKDPNAVKEQRAIPMREFGNKGFKVPACALGVMFDALGQIAVLRKALQLGVTFWDCAYAYDNGNAELGIGKILAEQPDLRKKMLITSKSGGTPDILENHLQESLKRLNTDYIDIYYGVHGLGNPAELTDELKNWAEGAKKRKLIKYFGFSTHSNMADNLTAAAKAGWIDAIITTYNFRVMQDPKMNDAVEACHKAGVALIAMKMQAKRQPAEKESPKEKEVMEYFTRKGFTEGQAKIKAVLQDKRICSACIGIGRGNIEHLITDVDAVLDERELSKKDLAFLAEHAKKTCDGYCAGCASICAAASPDMPYVADVMRYLMYYNGYSDAEMARRNYAQLPADVRAKMIIADYSLAERRCPNRLPIAKLVKEAARKLA